MGYMRVSLVVIGALLVTSISGCLVPESMTALREELGYASVDPPPDGVLKARATTLNPRALEAITLSAILEGYDLSQALITWDLGDGTTADGVEVSHAWSQAGSYEVVAMADLPHDLSAQDTLFFDVHENSVPIPSITVEARNMLEEGAPVVVSALGSVDADGDPLTYAWTFDGGSFANGSRIERDFAAGLHHVELHVSDGLAESVAFDAFGVSLALRGAGHLTPTADRVVLSFPALYGLQRLVVALTHTSTVSVDDVDLVLLDDAGDVVATSATQPETGATSGVETLEIMPPDLEPGSYALEARLVRGTASDVVIEGVLTYSPLAAP